MSEGTAAKVTYCTPEDVADTLDLPDPNDAMGMLKFTDLSHPTYKQVTRMIAANEDIIDRRLRRSWRENIVRDKLNTINTYWHDINGRRSDYFMEGGNFVQLRKDMREWNPFPVQTYQMDGSGHAIMHEAFTPNGDPIYVPKIEGGEGMGIFSWVPALNAEGNRMYDPSGVPMYVNVEEIMGGTEGEGVMRAMTPTVEATLYEGDRIYIRSTIHNMWRNASYVPSPPGDAYGDNMNMNIWFDYPYGKLYIRMPAYHQYKYNALKITYRYGSEEEVPYAIRRLCSLLTATQILSMQYYNVKVAVGGDLSNVKNDTISMWQTEMNSIWSSFQRSGSVHSMLR